MVHVSYIYGNSVVSRATPLAKTPPEGSGVHAYAYTVSFPMPPIDGEPYFQCTTYGAHAEFLW